MSVTDFDAFMKVKSEFQEELRSISKSRLAGTPIAIFDTSKYVVKYNMAEGGQAEPQRIYMPSAIPMPPKLELKGNLAATW